jgi:hypothetical protein
MHSTYLFVTFCITLLAVYASAANSTYIRVTLAPKTSNNPFIGRGFSSAYWLNGTEQPFLTLVRGHTYRFVTTGISCLHPLVISTSGIGGSGANASVYTNGVTGGGACSGATLTFTVPMDAPTTLYYQCGTHEYQGNKITIVDASGRICEKDRPLIVKALLKNTQSGGMYNLTGKFAVSYNGMLNQIKAVKKLVSSQPLVTAFGRAKFNFVVESDYSTRITVAAGTNGLTATTTVAFELSLAETALGTSDGFITAEVCIRVYVDNVLKFTTATKVVTLGAPCTIGDHPPVIVEGF